MECTQSILQLHKPIMEVCYVTFYLPRGKVRGFTYRNSATRHKSADCFDKCYQVREEAIKGQIRPSENLEAVVRQTTTQDVLGQLYKLTATKERLLANLLCSHRALNAKMGNQDGKYQDQQFQEDHSSGFHDTQESFSASIEKRNAGKGKKAKKFGKRRESLEEFVNRRIKRKSHGNLELPADLLGREVPVAKGKTLPPRLSIRSSSGSAARPGPHLVGNTEGSAPCAVTTEPATPTAARPHLQSWGTLDSEAELCSSLSEYDNDVFGDCVNLLPDSQTLLGEVEGVYRGMQGPGECSFLDAAFQESFEALAKSATEESWQGYEYRDHSYNESSAAAVVARARDLTPCMQRVERSCSPSGDDNFVAVKGFGGDSVTPVFQSLQHEFVARAEVVLVHGPGMEPGAHRLEGEKLKGTPVFPHHPNTQRICFERGSQAGVVNKNLLKVIQSDTVNEGDEWKGLQTLSADWPGSTEGRVDKGRPFMQDETRPGLLSLPLNSAHRIPQTSRQTKPEEQKRPVSPSLVAISNVFHTSYPTSNSLQQMSPIASPMSSRLPSPQLHHRILPLPTGVSVDEEEPGCEKHVEKESSPESSSSPSTSDSQPHLKSVEAGGRDLSSADSGLGTCATTELSREEHTPQPTLPPSDGWTPPNDDLLDEPGPRFTQSRGDQAFHWDFSAHEPNSEMVWEKGTKIDRNTLHLTLDLNIDPR